MVRRGLVLLVTLGAAGCVLAPIDLAGRPCPCAEGWTCDPENDTCIEGALDGGARDAPSDAPADDPPDAPSDATEPIDAVSPLPPDCALRAYRGHDYAFCNAEVPSFTARSVCASAGMRLARIDDAAENEWIHATAIDTGAGEVTIGASDQAVEGSWQWPDGVTFWIASADGGAPVGGLFQAWLVGEPNAFNEREDCARIFADQSTWHDYPCDLAADYVCERF
jgi:hypothetical protein